MNKEMAMWYPFTNIFNQTQQPFPHQPIFPIGNPLEDESLHITPPLHCHPLPTTFKSTPHIPLKPYSACWLTFKNTLKYLTKASQLIFSTHCQEYFNKQNKLDDPIMEALSHSIEWQLQKLVNCDFLP
jgi:hypothetical protein